MAYPQGLYNELVKFGQQPTGNIDWDKAVLDLCKRHADDELRVICAFGPIIEKCRKAEEKQRLSLPDLSITAVYDAHAKFLIHIANNIVLAPQRRKFEIDEHNKQVLRFLLLYFNECPLAEEVFPGRGYKLHKNIMIQGGVGVGKTMLMQIFSEYLKLTNNPRYFHNVSVTQMVNHYSIHNDIDSYLYNIKETRSFQGRPVNLCLNDIGVETRPFYGIDTTQIVHDFLHARNEIWSNHSECDGRFAHLTTNLTTDQLKELFNAKDSYGRVVDRFKTYNIIPLTGESRR